MNALDFDQLPDNLPDMRLHTMCPMCDHYIENIMDDAKANAMEEEHEKCAVGNNPLRFDKCYDFRT